MMSTSSTRFCRKRGPSTSWTAATWILNVFTSSRSAAFFVVRTKSNVLLQRRYSHPVDKTTGVRSDHTVILTAIGSAKVYPDPLRRVSYLDVETRKRFKFPTNNFTLPALTIALIYKARWQVELFFKWIKQHLRIKSFYGTSENAVKTQIWIAVSIYVLVAIVRKRLGLEIGLYQILQVLSVTLFEKTPILQALQPPDSQQDLLSSANQLILFDLWPDSCDPPYTGPTNVVVGQQIILTTVAPLPAGAAIQEPAVDRAGDNDRRIPHPDRPQRQPPGDRRSYAGKLHTELNHILLG